MRMIRYALLALVPLAPVLHYALGLPALWVFAAGILGVGVLAEWIRIATEQLALRTGPAIGGLRSGDAYFRIGPLIASG